MFPPASVAVYVTVVFPNGNISGALSDISADTLSVAVASPNSTAVALDAPGSVDTMTSSGAVIVGAVVSSTVMV